jgi:hypothetical protein
MWVAMGVSISIWRPTTSVRRLARRTVLFQVLAESRQFAVWHQDQVIKLLPIKGLVGQEMALSDYLKYIRQEALAAPRRSSARRGRQSPTAFSLGRRSLIAFFPSSSARFLRRLPCTRASVGKMLFPCRAKTPRNQKQSATWAPLVADGTLFLFTRFFFLSHLSFPFFNPCYFDEATQPPVSMTESHTHCASRGSPHELCNEVKQQE